MKIALLLSLLLCLSACSLGKSSEIKLAEQLLNQFECKNIDSDQLSHSPITSFHERTLYVSKDKAVQYLESYKSGDYLFDLPLENVIQEQYTSFKSACEFLGGVTISLKTQSD